LRVEAILSAALLPLVATYIVIMLLLFDDIRNVPHLQYLLVGPVAYGLGSIPWGYMLSRVVSGVDVRLHGSGSTGTTNVMRSSGLKIGIIVLLLDISKGVLAVVFANAVSNYSPGVVVVAGILVVIGHNWPITLKFKGGKGIATGSGATLVILPEALVVGAAIFLIITMWRRYVSLGSLSSVVAVNLCLIIFSGIGQLSVVYVWYGLAGAVIIFWSHRGNVNRLLNGTERKLGD